MRVVKELHELEHPLHEYVCRKTLVGGEGYDVYVVLNTFNFSLTLPFKREYLATKLKHTEALKLADETNALINAAVRIAT